MSSLPAFTMPGGGLLVGEALGAKALAMSAWAWACSSHATQRICRSECDKILRYGSKTKMMWVVRSHRHRAFAIGGWWPSSSTLEASSSASEGST